MRIVSRRAVPTGDILVVEGDKGPLELLSIGDYGKDANLKADFLGLTDDIEQVVHQELLPLEKKWVITISTQYGCSMNCTFCDVPKVGPGKNATMDDLIDQVMMGINLHPEVHSTNRLNIHYARMGEPTWNPAVLEATERIHALVNNTHRIHPVVSTMMPANNKWLRPFIHEWMRLKNGFLAGEAGLQLSINSTSETERRAMFSRNALELEEISYVMKGIIPVGRKITLNFAVAGYEINPKVLLKYFDPKHYLIKLTPMHKTTSAEANNIKTDGDYTTFHPYAEDEQRLKAAGYDVIVFIMSQEEDTSKITCGNAILADIT